MSDGEVMTERAKAIELELQQLIKEQTEDLGQLIEDTVRMHDNCKREVATLFAQDKEEDAVVRELVLRAELAERELQRNPHYEAYREGDEARLKQERQVTGFYHWVRDPALAAHGEWCDIVELTAEDCDQFMRSKHRPVEEDELPVEVPDNLLKLAARVEHHDAANPVYVKVNGCPVGDLQYNAASSGRDLLGAATSLVRAWRTGPRGREPLHKGPVSDLEINTLSHTLRKLQSRAEAPAIAALKGSKRLQVDHIRPAVIQNIPVYVAIVPLEGALHKMRVRGVVTKGALRVVENANAGTHYPAMDVPAVRNAVEKFVETVCIPKADVFGPNFVVEMMVDPPLDDADAVQVKLSWVHKLTTDILSLVSWDKLCELSLTPQAPVWFAGSKTPALLAPEKDAVFNLLVSEREHLAPGGHTCWETKDTATTDFMSALPASVSAPAVPAGDVGDVTATRDEPSLLAQIPVGTIGIAAAAFVAGVFLARKK